MKIEQVEVSVSNNFELLWELRYKLENLWENDIKREESGNDMMKKWEGWIAVAMD